MPQGRKSDHDTCPREHEPRHTRSDVPSLRERRVDNKRPKNRACGTQGICRVPRDGLGKRSTFAHSTSCTVSPDQDLYYPSHLSWLTHSHTDVLLTLAHPTNRPRTRPRWLLGRLMRTPTNPRNLAWMAPRLAMTIPTPFTATRVPRTLRLLPVTPQCVPI